MSGGGWIRVTLVVGPLSRARWAARGFLFAFRAARRGDACDCCGCFSCRCPLPDEGGWPVCACSRLGSAVLRVAHPAWRGLPLRLAWGGVRRPFVRRGVRRSPERAVADPRLALWTAWL